MENSNINTMELTNDEVATVTTLVTHIKSVDNSSNSVFATCKAFFTRNDKSKTKAIRAGLTKQMNIIIKDEESHIKSRVTKVVTIAGDFIGYKMDETDLYFNRIEEITTLMKFFEQDSEGVLLNSFAEVREKFNDILGNEVKLAKRAFNEEVTVLIEQIKTDNKIDDGEELVFKGTKEQLIAMIKAQFADDLESIAKALVA